MTRLLLALLLASCQEAPEHTACAHTHALELSEPVEQIGSRAAARTLPLCLGLSPSYLALPGAQEAAQEAIDLWLVATGHEPGSVPARLDTQCPITVGAGQTPIVCDGERCASALGYAAPGGHITILDANPWGQSCRGVEGVRLLGVMAHEIGHELGCGHPADSVMAESRGSCDGADVNGIAAACATSLHF